VKIAFLSHLDLNLYLFRLSWMEALREEGHEILVIVPRGEYFNHFRERGIEAVPWRLKREKAGLAGALRGLYDLQKILRKRRPDAVHTFTLLPNLLGAMAGKMAGVPSIFQHVTGLGYLHTSRGPKASLIRTALSPLYRFSFKVAREVVFQNPDDMAALRGMLPLGKGRVIKGSGVDTEYFSPERADPRIVEHLREEIAAGDCLVVTLIGRLLRHKGIREYCEAAERLTTRGMRAIFVVVGWADEGNPAVVDPEFIEYAQSKEFMRFLGKRDEIREVLALTDVYCLPSYREGTPRTVLEAMSMGVPVVTTDVPGCRQTVEEGVSGLLVPSRDSTRLADAMERLLADSDLRLSLGKAGRARVLDEFSNKIVIRQVLSLYDEESV